MPRLTIQFYPRAGGAPLLLRVSLVSDEDTTPREHEQDHRRHLRALLGGLDLDDPDNTSLVVERERPAVEPSLPCSCGDDGYEVIDLG